MDIAKKHQMAIARRTLAMSISGARIMGGMDYPQAYELVFRQPLLDRLNTLVAEYGDSETVCWELSRYGHAPKKMLIELQS